MTVSSDRLGARQMRGLDRLGDAIVPGDGRLPSFSRSGCANAVDEIVAWLPETDRRDVALLLTVLGWLPAVAARGLVALADRSPSMRGPLGPSLRLARIGMRGLVMSLYFSHPAILDAIDYEVSVVPDDHGNVAPMPR